MEAGTTYKSIEVYLEALEKRQAREKAPTAACFMLGSYEMLTLEYGGHPWLTRVRCELPTRPLGPHGDEEPVRATFIGANSKEEPTHYETFVKAMALIDVTRCEHLKAASPTRKALAHLEQSDIVVLGDGPHVDEAWLNIGECSSCGLLERIRWRYYCGAVMIGVGTGAMLLGKKWWVGDPRQELEARQESYEERQAKEKKPIEERFCGKDYNTGKAMEIVPGIHTAAALTSPSSAAHDCALITPHRTPLTTLYSFAPGLFSTDVDTNSAVAEVQGAVAAVILLSPRAACIFNVDGTLEPCNEVLYEHLWDWKKEEVKTYVQHSKHTGAHCAILY